VKHLTLALNGREPTVAIERLLAFLPRPKSRWSALGRTPVAVWLSGALARPFVFKPVLGLRTRQEARQAAAVLAPQACGLDGPCAVWLDRQAALDAPALGVAVEQSVLDRLEAAIEAHGLRMAHIRPAWAVLDGAHEVPDDHLWSVSERDSVTMLVRRSGQWAFAATYAPAIDEDTAAGVRQRLQASTGLGDESVTSHHVEDGADGAPPRSRPVAASLAAT
jgi:hypothetical protein